MTIAQYLKKTKMSRAELARKAGVDPSTIWRYMKHKRVPRQGQVMKIVGATRGEVTAEEIVANVGKITRSRYEF